jgi:hypothetical protein
MGLPIADWQLPIVGRAGRVPGLNRQSASVKPLQRTFAIGNQKETVAAKGDRVTDGTRPVLLMAASFPT